MWSLIISVGFHLIITLAVFFGNTLFFTEEIKAFQQYNFSIWRFLIFTSLHFVMVFVILLYNQIVMIHHIKNRFVELTLMFLGSLIIAGVLSIGFVFTVWPAGITQTV